MKVTKQNNILALLAKQMLFLLILLFVYGSVFAQRGANWYFGQNAAIKFTASGPVAVAGSQIDTREGCSTISDENGNLLFYTDGVSVWNKSNALMANGTGLRGNSSSAQSSIVVPDPGNNQRYYIFTSAQQEAGNNLKVYCYNIIDMTLQNGLGEIVVKNVVFDTLCSERLTAVLHRNGTDYWILTNTTGSNTYKAFLLSVNGLSNQPVVSNVGSIVQQGLGFMKVSPDSKWLIQTACVLTANAALCQLFTFNNSNGQITNPIRLQFPSSFNCSYGCAFSPNNKRLYIGNVNPVNGCFQFTIDSGIDSIINKSRTAFAFAGTFNSVGDFSLGPDNRLYIVRENLNRLSCIANPNDSATTINIIDTAIILSPNAVGKIGLPNFYNSINAPNSNIKAEQLACLTYTFSFTIRNTFNFNGLYRWNFGDGSAISTDSVPTHTFKRNGIDSFLVTLNFRSSDNLVSVNEEVWIKLPLKPIAKFTVGNTGCLNDSIRLNNNSTSTNGIITANNWILGDGTTSALINPIKRYTSLGNYNVSLFVKDTLQCFSDTTNTQVVLDKNVIANFQLQGNYCTNKPLPLIDSSIATNTSVSNWWYGWGSGNIYTSSVNGNFSPTFTNEAFVSIKAAERSVEGCKSDTVTKTYFINNSPKANFILPKSCVLDISEFVSTSTITGGSSINFWKWDFGVANITADTAITAIARYQYNNAAQYAVTLAVATNKGCADTLIQNFTVNGATPKANFLFAQNPICGKDSVVLINKSTVNFGFITTIQISWGAFAEIDNSPTPNKTYGFKYPEFGTPSSIIQPIKIRAFSGQSCFSDIDTIITINAQPRVSFVLPIDSLCGNGSSILLNQGRELNGTAGTFKYEGLGVAGSANNGFIFSPRNIPFNRPTNITYRFTTPSGCFDTVTQNIQVVDFPFVNAGNGRIIESGEKIILQAFARGNNLRFFWTPAALTNNASILQPTVSTTKDTTFLLTAINTFGCIDTSSVKIRVLPPVVPPNAFSPNGDGINDTWQIKSLNDYPASEIIIYNRYGQPVYHSIGYRNPWNGTFNNHPVPVATYYYVINLKNGKPPIGGWVQLVR